MTATIQIALTLQTQAHSATYLGISTVLILRCWNYSSLHRWRDAAEEGVLALLHLTLATLMSVHFAVT
jgi:hypothetical protein